MSESIRDKLTKIEEAKVQGAADQKVLDRRMLRGVMLQWVKYTGPMVVPSEEFDPEILAQRFYHYAKERWKSEWILIMGDLVTKDDLINTSEEMYEKHDEFRDFVDEKWTYSETHENLSKGGTSRGTGGTGPPTSLKDWNETVGTVIEEDREISLTRRKNLEDFSEVSDEFIRDDKEEKESTPDLDIEITGQDLINGDSVEVLDYIASEHGRIADAIITDVPYGQAYSGGRGDEFEMIEADESVKAAMRVNTEVFKKARLTLNHGSMVVTTVGFDAFLDMANLFDEWYNLYRPAVWDKEYVSMGHSQIAYRPNHEYVLYASYGQPDFENPNRHEGSVLRFQRPDSHNRIHPTEKPVELMAYLIESFTEEGGLVVDPFAGSGATLVAAKKLGRDYIGIELDEDYYQAAKKRLEQQVLGGIT